MPDLDVGSVVWWVVDSRTGKTFGKPRPSEVAALKRAESANAAFLATGENRGAGLGPVYVVRAAKVVAATEIEQSAMGQAMDATRKATKAASGKPEDYAWTAAEALAITDLHQEALELWFGLWSESHDEFHAFLADSHESEQDNWLEFVKECD